MKIIYVHGIAQEGKSEQLVGEEWDAALREGLRNAGLAWPANATTVTPFYGRVLADKTAEVDRGEAVGLLRKGSNEAENARKFEFYDELLGEIAAARRVRTDDLLGDDGRPVQKGLLNWPWVNALVRRLNDIKPLADWSIDTFTRDVWVYLNYTMVRLPVDEIVARKLPADEPCVIVAHSLGTVVSYNVLTQLADRSRIRGWITLGSPLGIESIYSRIPSEPGKPRRAPSGIPTWYNARDPEDVVALHPVPAGRFAGSPVVENASHVSNRTSNEHGIRGYLSDADVARRIHAAATS
jgi:hypothetical protein